MHYPASAPGQPRSSTTGISAIDAVANAVRVQRRVPVPQAHEHVDPVRVPLGLTHVGGRRIRVGVRVTVPAPDELFATRFGVATRAQEVARVDGVRDGRRVRVLARARFADDTRRLVTRRDRADEQAARFVGQSVVAVARRSTRYCDSVSRSVGVANCELMKLLVRPGSRATLARPCTACRRAGSRGATAHRRSRCARRASSRSSPTRRCPSRPTG